MATVRLTSLDKLADVQRLGEEAATVRGQLGEVEDRRAALVARRHAIALELVALGVSYRAAARLCGFTEGVVSMLVAAERRKGRTFPNSRPRRERPAATDP